jgi:hypothetical protein
MRREPIRIRWGRMGSLEDESGQGGNKTLLVLLGSRCRSHRRPSQDRCPEVVMELAFLLLSA